MEIARPGWKFCDFSESEHFHGSAEKHEQPEIFFQRFVSKVEPQLWYQNLWEKCISESSLNLQVVQGIAESLGYMLVCVIVLVSSF